MIKIPFASLHVDHDSTLTFMHDGEIYNFEFERLFSKRYFGWTTKYNHSESAYFGNAFLLSKTLRNLFGDEKVQIDTIHFNQDSNWYEEDEIYIRSVESAIKHLFHLFSVNKIEELSHHDSHASGAFALSGFDESLIFSIDGGGSKAYKRCYLNMDDSVEYFNVYVASKDCGLRLLSSIPLDMSLWYNSGSNIVNVVQPNDELKSAGKFMGLSGHGVPNPLLVNKLKRLFFEEPFTRGNLGSIDFQKYLNVFDIDIQQTEGFVNSVSDFDDCAFFSATWQETFEQIIMECIEPFVLKYDFPICLTGGCALNVLLNERIRKVTGQEVFVPPNPNDSGLALGGWFLENWDKVGQYDVVYNGWDILDRGTLDEYERDYVNNICDVTELSQRLITGEIVGVVGGRSECGPRALGNRSILCDPSIPDMKDILNSKVKDREWYRPFAPVVRYEDRNKYFRFDGDSPYMSFATQVRAKYQKKLQAITHVDGSARIQTVKRNQNEFLYDLLTEIEQRGKIPVLLNTSFNIKGNPILTTIKDALYVLDNTELDAVYVEGTLFTDRR